MNYVGRKVYTPTQICFLCLMVVMRFFLSLRFCLLHQLFILQALIVALRAAFVNCPSEMLALPPTLVYCKTSLSSGVILLLSSPFLSSILSLCLSFTPQSSTRLDAHLLSSFISRPPKRPVLLFPFVAFSPLFSFTLVSFPLVLEVFIFLLMDERFGDCLQWLVSNSFSLF